jgi:hypothetical protein
MGSAPQGRGRGGGRLRLTAFSVYAPLAFRTTVTCVRCGWLSRVGDQRGHLGAHLKGSARDAHFDAFWTVYSARSRINLGLDLVNSGCAVASQNLPEGERDDKAHSLFNLCAAPAMGEARERTP